VAEKRAEAQHQKGAPHTLRRALCAQCALCTAVHLQDSKVSSARRSLVGQALWRALRCAIALLRRRQLPADEDASHRRLAPPGDCAFSDWPARAAPKHRPPVPSGWLARTLVARNLCLSLVSPALRTPRRQSPLQKRFPLLRFCQLPICATNGPPLITDTRALTVQWAELKIGDHSTATQCKPQLSSPAQWPAQTIAIPPASNGQQSKVANAAAWEQLETG